MSAVLNAFETTKVNVTYGRVHYRPVFMMLHDARACVFKQGRLLRQLVFLAQVPDVIPTVSLAAARLCVPSISTAAVHGVLPVYAHRDTTCCTGTVACWQARFCSCSWQCSSEQGGGQSGR